MNWHPKQDEVPKPAVQLPFKSLHPHVYPGKLGQKVLFLQGRCCPTRRDTQKDSHLAAGEPQAAELNALNPNGTN